MRCAGCRPSWACGWRPRQQRKPLVMLFPRSVGDVVSPLRSFFFFSVFVWRLVERPSSLPMRTFVARLDRLLRRVPLGLLSPLAKGCFCFISSGCKLHVHHVL